MTKFLVVASAKGGVGKTTTAINLGSALNSIGSDVVIIDGNLSTPNVSLYLGAPYVPVTLHEVLRGSKSIGDAVYSHEQGFKIVPGNIADNSMEGIDHGRMSEVVLGLTGSADVVIIDSAAGLGREATEAVKAGDEVVVVTTPDIASVTNALKTIRLAKRLNKKVLGVVLTRVNEDNIELPKKDIELLLETPVIGVIPEDDTVRLAQKMKHPVTHTHPNAPSAVGYRKLASQLLGKKYVEAVNSEDTFLDYALKRLGLK